ncbi:hypothetical protein AKJ09_02262 [Labilithrix luteola]|uniref:DUF1585 domain-containing protein n=1 Tax=Labilithrix luteola TaxID=1391654 RepID=A0A0K1PPZ6_9BACT|nr:DUF1585 domain-containing protein [Labilithrix luteola]AKU95598.1 hypothetical protein AKJ09_02262 [Labilithrix luteola]
MSRSRGNVFASLLVSIVVLAVSVPFALDARSAPSAKAPDTPVAKPRTLDDYRHFRIASIDLLGRMPTRDEIAAFERPNFDFDKWIDGRLRGPTYVERLTRIYMDLLRLEPNLNFSPAPAQLYRHEVLEADGTKTLVYYRRTQRREAAAVDGEFCFSPDEMGVVVRPNAPDVGTLKPISKKLLDERTVLVRPWWLYRDYKSAQPTQRYMAEWSNPDVQYKPVESLLSEPDGKPTTAIRICREEASTSELGHVYTSGRTKAPGRDDKLPGGRTSPPPLDKPFALQHKGERVSCDTRAALENAVDCGCGVGLERCIPNDGNGEGNAFYFPNKMPLGPGFPLDLAKQRAERWYPYWWSREAVHFLDDLFDEDRDFRQILTGRQSFVNGPLAQFYRTIQRTNCCGPETSFGMNEELSPLFDPKNVPADLMPHDVDTWRLVSDRGPHAAGILTTPMFLQKYATARARAAVLYNAFLCKSFVAENAQLTPSTEPNLMKRPGCQTCHATLEPLAAYFARVEPSSSVFLPATNFPAINSACRKDKNGKLNGNCNALYDVAFADDKGATLRSAYGSISNADAEPVGAGRAVTQMPEFAECAVQRVTSSFLGRPTSPDDAALLASLQKDFVASGYRMRALVRGIVRSREYRDANNVGSAPDAGDKP